MKCQHSGRKGYFPQPLYTRLGQHIRSLWIAKLSRHAAEGIASRDRVGAVSFLFGRLWCCRTGQPKKDFHCRVEWLTMHTFNRLHHCFGRPIVHSACSLHAQSYGYRREAVWRGLHACDDAMFARHALQVNRTYNLRCLTSCIATDAFVEMRLSFPYDARVPLL